MSIKITADLPAQELIEKDEEEKDCLIKLSCEALEDDIILELEDKRQFKIAAGDLMECIARVSQPFPTVKPAEDD